MSTAALCPRCETLPEARFGAGTVHFLFPLTHTLGKVQAAFSAAGIAFGSAATGLLTVSVDAPGLSPMLAAAVAALTSVERADVRAIFQPAGAELTFADTMRAGSLDTLYATSRSEWLLSMLREERLSSAFQPIVRASDRRVFAYELLMRGREQEAVVYPSQILEVARGADLLFQLDLAARKAAIRCAGRAQVQCKVFINFIPTSIYDPNFCLRSTVQAADEVGLRHDQIVFEVVESDHVADVGHLKNIMRYYQERGFGVALDDLGSGYSSLNMLAELRPDYAKVDIGLVRDVHKDPYKAIIARKLLEAARELGIRTIAEGVEVEGEADWFTENGADLIQGYYFAKPAMEPPMRELQIAVE